MKKVPTKKAASKKAPAKKAAGKASAPISKKKDAPVTGKRPFIEPHFVVPVDEGMNPGRLPLREVLDEGEIAQHLQLQEQASISHRARELNRPESHPDFDGETCVECGEEIPPARLILKRVRCVDCQSFLEEESARLRRLQG